MNDSTASSITPAKLEEVLQHVQAFNQQMVKKLVCKTWGWTDPPPVDFLAGSPKSGDTIWMYQQPLTEQIISSNKNYLETLLRQLEVDLLCNTYVPAPFTGDPHRN